MPVKSARKPARKSAAPRRSPASGGRIPTTHVGSLVRPPRLREFLAAQRDGQPYDEPAFETCLHDSVAEVVRKQVEFGLDVVNDCECGKTISGSRYVLRRLSGFEQRGQREACGSPAAVSVGTTPNVPRTPARTSSIRPSGRSRTISAMRLIAVHCPSRRYQRSMRRRRACSVRQPTHRRASAHRHP